MKNLTNWSRLASAALTAPDDLRYLIRALDQTIAAKAPSISLLIRVREIAIHIMSKAVRPALKHPPQPKR